MKIFDMFKGVFKDEARREIMEGDLLRKFLGDEDFMKFLNRHFREMADHAFETDYSTRREEALEREILKLQSKALAAVGRGEETLHCWGVSDFGIGYEYVRVFCERFDFTYTVQQPTGAHKINLVPKVKAPKEEKPRNPGMGRFSRSFPDALNY